MERNIKNILVRMPNWIGDLIMATAVLEELKKKYPKAKITAMCLKANCPLLQNNPFIDEILAFEKCSIFSKKGAFLIKELKEKKFDMGILLTNSFSSAYFFYGAKIPLRVGYKMHFRSFLLNIKRRFPKEKQHLVETYLDLLKSLSINASASPKIFLSKNAQDSAKKTLKEIGYRGEKLIGVNPFAAYGSAKCWPLERFLKIAEVLASEGFFVVFFGSKKDKISFVEKPNIVNLVGKTDLEELSALIKECHLFLTNDSGPMHIAAALNVPLLALFGSTDEKQTGPYKTGRIIKKKTLCSPCFQRVCKRDFACMLNIETKEVIETIKQMLYA